MVDDQVHGRQRIDSLRVGAGFGHGVAHGGEVDDGGNAGEVLHQYAGRAVADLVVRAAVLQPVGDGLAVIGPHGRTVFPAQQVFQQDLERKRQAADVAQAFRRFRQAEVVIGLAVDFKATAAVQAVLRRHDEAPYGVTALRSGNVLCT
ncbi:hypothetical protein D3C77_607840 [compost metagenome]